MMRKWLFGLLTALVLGVGNTSVWASEQGIKLNLENADLRKFVALVANATGRNFILDPKVKGKVTIYGGAQLGGEALYQIFLDILRVHGFAVVPVRGALKVVPDKDIARDPHPVESLNQAVGETAELATAIHKLVYLDPVKMVSVLKGLLSPNGNMSFYQASNTLMLTDTRANLSKLNNILKRLDRAGDSPVEVVPLKHASATELVRLLGKMVSSDKDMKTANPPYMVADERTNSILIGGGRMHRMRLSALAEHLDRPLQTTGNTQVLFLHHAKAENLVSILQSVAREVEKQKGAGKDHAATGQATTVRAYAESNALVLTGPPDLLNQMRTVINQLDTRRAQVHVEAVIAEVREGMLDELGFQWRFAPGSTDSKGVLGGTNFNATGNGINTLSSNPLAASGGLSVGYSLGSSTFGGAEIIDLAAMIRAVAGDSISNVLSTPSLMTLDNQTAEILVGDDVPFITGSYSQGGNSNINPFTTIKREKVGIRLKVRPQINAGNLVRMEIEQEVSDVTARVGPSGDMITSNRSINTVVQVADGEVLVLGGLIKDKLEETFQKVPFFGDIPLLGALFRYRDTEKIKTNLMVFLRPKIVMNDDSGWDVTNSRYQHIRRLQQKYQPDEFTGAVLPVDPRKSKILGFEPTPAPETPSEEESMDHGDEAALKEREVALRDLGHDVD